MRSHDCWTCSKEILPDEESEQIVNFHFHVENSDGRRCFDEERAKYPIPEIIFPTTEHHVHVGHSY